VNQWGYYEQLTVPGSEPPQVMVHPVDPSNTATTAAAAAPAFNIRRLVLFAFIGRAFRLRVYSRVGPPVDVTATTSALHLIRLDEISLIEIRPGLRKLKIPGHSIALDHFRMGSLRKSHRRNSSLCLDSEDPLQPDRSVSGLQILNQLPHRHVITA